MSILIRSNTRFDEAIDSVGPFTTGQVRSIDGTPIGYRQVGSGPGLVIMHGALRASQHYTRLALALADSFTVTIPDRRGRGLSGPAGDNYSIDKEIADLRAILMKSGANMLFGHSTGGFFALEAALHLPVRKLALYEPAVSICGSLPFDWLPAYEQALAQNDAAAAYAGLIKGMEITWTSSLPAWTLMPYTRLRLRGEGGQEIARLLPAMAWEAREMQRLEQVGQTYERYHFLAAATLLLNGSKSPAHLRDAAQVVAETIPQARRIELIGLDHNAPDQNAPEAVAAALKPFFA